MSAQTGGATAEDERATIPHKLRQHFDAMAGLTEAVCREHPNEEYAVLC